MDYFQISPQWPDDPGPSHLLQSLPGQLEHPGLLGGLQVGLEGAVPHPDVLTPRPDQMTLELLLVFFFCGANALIR